MLLFFTTVTFGSEEKPAGLVGPHLEDLGLALSCILNPSVRTLLLGTRCASDGVFHELYAIMVSQNRILHSSHTYYAKITSVVSCIMACQCAVVLKD